MNEICKTAFYRADIMLQKEKTVVTLSNVRVFSLTPTKKDCKRSTEIVEP